MRREAVKHTMETIPQRAARSRCGGRRTRAVAAVSIASALDAPDPSWLPAPLDEWDDNTEIVERYTSARHDD